MRSGLISSAIFSSGRKNGDRVFIMLLVPAVAISLFSILGVMSCGYDGQTRCEKAKAVALDGYKGYCAGKEEICGSCYGCDGNVTALGMIWNQYGTERITYCIVDSSESRCVVLTDLDVDICQCEGASLEWAVSCLEDKDGCRQAWADIAQHYCEKSMN